MLTVEKRVSMSLWEWKRFLSSIYIVGSKNADAFREEIITVQVLNLGEHYMKQTQKKYLWTVCNFLNIFETIVDFSLYAIIF